MRIKILLIFFASTFFIYWEEVGAAMPFAGKVTGTVTISGTGFAASQATVLLIPLGWSTITDETGRYSLEGLPPGNYEVIVHMHALTDERKSLHLEDGQTATVDFDLKLSPLRQELTVTAAGRETTVFDSLQSVVTMDSIQLKEKNAFGLGEVLENQLGVAKRSFGPGSARPILRGFDGDRVLILQDGLPSGTLSSQSGEHAEPIDAADLERIEVVKGPAALLYGSNAIGGVVNTVTEHHMFHEHSHEGLRGHFSMGGSSNHHQAGISSGFEYGYKKWMIWGTGGRQVAGDYSSPEGRVNNSKTRLTSGSLGWGWFGAKPFINGTYSFHKGRFGVPYAGEFHEHHDDDPVKNPLSATTWLEGEIDDPDPAENQVDETFTRQSVRWNAGLRDLQHFIEKIRFSAAYTRWMHHEVENGDTVATAFDNRVFHLRGVFEQRKIGSWNGSIGFQLMTRDYRAEGEEALSPPVDQTGIALFGLQELAYKKVKLQFGGRWDCSHYDPKGLSQRSFQSFSGAAGIRIPLWEDGAFVANYNHASRAPALEELYNYGPHVGNMAFEIGNPDLKSEDSDGLDLSWRHDAARVRGEVNLFYYRLGSFVYMAPSGELRHGLPAVNFLQGNARFIGSEARLDLGLNPLLWLNLGFDTVSAHLIEGEVPLPRIPPLRLRLGFDFRHRGLSIRPELLLAGAQQETFLNETSTAGYGVLNLTASYTIPSRHSAQVFSVSTFNLVDRLYRNHCSFLKELAPEIGRGIRFHYSLHFF